MKYQLIEPPPDWESALMDLERKPLEMPVFAPPAVDSPFLRMMEFSQRQMAKACGVPLGMFSAEPGTVTVPRRPLRFHVAVDMERQSQFWSGPSLREIEAEISEKLQRHTLARIWEDLHRRAVAAEACTAPGSHVLTWEDIAAVWRQYDPEPWLGTMKLPTEVLLDESLRQWWRKPRSKKKRIRAKWRKRPENWRPSPLIYQTKLLIGAKAARFGYGSTGAMGYAYASQVVPSPEPVRDGMLLMHPEMWERLKREAPEFAATCVVRRRQTPTAGTSMRGF